MQSSNKLNFEIATANLPIIYIYVLFKDCYTILKLSLKSIIILGFLRIDAASEEDQKVIKINVFFGYRCMELYIGTHLQMHGLVFKYLR